MRWKHKRFWLGGLCLLVSLEVLFQTKIIDHPDPIKLAWASWGYFLLGILVAWFPLLTPRDLIPTKGNSLRWLSCLSLVLPWSIGLCLGLQLWQSGAQIITNFPIDFRQADMLAVIEVQCERFLHGESVYEIIPDIWTGMQPIYLPGFWGAFVPAKILGLDIRWTTLLVLSLSMLLMLGQISMSKQRQGFLVLLVVLPLYFLFESIWSEQTFLIRFTEEGISIFYYVLLGIGLYRKNPWLEGVALALCLLSRYALLPWIIIYLWWIYHNRGYRQAVWVGGTAFLLVMCLFVLPFGLEKWEIFIGHPMRYQGYAERLWLRDDVFFERTLGLSKFFGAGGVRWQHQLHISSVWVAPLLMMIWVKRTKRLLHPAIIAHFFTLCSLKLSLVFFYNLIVVPVYYLFFVNGALSCVLLACYVDFLGSNRDVSELEPMAPFRKLA